MDEKKCEPGRVEISSAEYRDLVKEAIEARHEASDTRSRNWQLLSEKEKLNKDLKEAHKKIAELECFIEKNFQTFTSHAINGGN